MNKTGVKSLKLYVKVAVKAKNRIWLIDENTVVFKVRE